MGDALSGRVVHFLADGRSAEEFWEGGKCIKAEPPTDPKPCALFADVPSSPSSASSGGDGCASPSTSSPISAEISTVSDLLRKLRLERYEEAFARKGISLDSLLLCTDSDLAELNVRKGPRIRIVHECAELLKQRVAQMYAPKVSADSSK